ncbi:MAG: N,N-dimethylformamidase beta subunit family domain-containing protein [Candidatus Limnocylindrales bacterium]
MNSDVPFDVDWYRLGWYHGDGGRLVRTDRGLRPQAGGPLNPDPETGLVEAPWPAALEIQVPAEWTSGMYSVVIRGGRPGPTGRIPRGTEAGAVVATAPFIVRPAGGIGVTPAPVLFVSAGITWQAYNPWGGADLYGASAEDAPDAAAGRRAVVVGFDRPYTLDYGSGYQRRWELQFVRWQEREERDVEYMMDVDLELHPELLKGRRLIVFAGHHEYWSRPMRTAIEGAIAAGINVAFLSANEIFWQVRLGPSRLGPGRQVTCYKSASLDPFATTNPALTTTRWRQPPVSDPEASVIGQMYGHIVRSPGDWVVRSSGHWLYQGTGLRDGDRIANLIGQEYDTYFPQFAHPGTVLLAQGPIDAVIHGTEIYPSPAIHTATMYTADSGATVFSAGTFQWSWALDAYGDRSYAGVRTPFDRRLGIMTGNLFDRLGDGPG